MVQDMSHKPEEVQCSLFRIALGADGKKLLRNQPVPTRSDGTPMDRGKLTTLMQMMKTAIMGEVNDTYEWYVFRARTQQKGEKFDDFLLDLRELMKTCDICEHMSDRFLKSQVIIGIREDATREKLLQERDLTLVKCLDMCRAAESASAQTREMSGDTDAEVNRVQNFGKKTGWTPRGDVRRQSTTKTDKKECRFCGQWHVMSRGVCPALGKTCSKCGQRNHFAKKCRRNVQHVDAAFSDDTCDWPYADNEIGAVTYHVCGLDTSPRAKLRVQGKSKAFLLDTGATANLISTQDLDVRKLRLSTPGRTFTMWNGSMQKTIGREHVPALYNPVTRRTYQVNFDVVPAKLTPILGCSTIQEMGLVQINSDRYVTVRNVQPALKSIRMTTSTNTQPCSRGT